MKVYIILVCTQQQWALQVTPVGFYTQKRRSEKNNKKRAGTSNMCFSFTWPKLNTLSILSILVRAVLNWVSKVNQADYFGFGFMTVIQNRSTKSRYFTTVPTCQKNAGVVLEAFLFSLEVEFSFLFKITLGQQICPFCFNISEEHG